MKRNLAVTLTVLLAGAALMAAQQARAQATQTTTVQTLPLTGNVNGELPAGARVGVWLVGATGAPLEEITSASVSGARFALNVAADAPASRALRALTAESITWPGVTGAVNVQGGAMIAEARLFVYGDANTSGRRETNEPLLETTSQLGRASVLLLYVDRPVTVTASRGFEARLEPGWNVLSVDLGKNLKASVARSAQGLNVSAIR